MTNSHDLPLSASCLLNGLALLNSGLPLQARSDLNNIMDDTIDEALLDPFFGVDFNEFVHNDFLQGFPEDSAHLLPSNKLELDLPSANLPSSVEQSALSKCHDEYSDLRGVSEMDLPRLGQQSEITNHPSNWAVLGTLANSTSLEELGIYQASQNNTTVIKNKITVERFAPSAIYLPDMNLGPQNPVEPHDGQLHLPKSKEYPVLIRDLPSNTTENHLRSQLAWSDEYVQGDVLHPGTDSCSALLYFSSMHSAQEAIRTLHGRQYGNNNAIIQVDTVQTCSLVPQSPRDATVVSLKRRKFSSQDKTYLEGQFAASPYPSAENRAEFAAHLDIPEKQIQTWFNNKRQRAKDKSGPKSTPLTRRSLDNLSLVQSSSQSPIERFAALPPGSDGEPSVAVIEAAIKEKLAVGSGQEVASLSFSVSDDSSVPAEIPNAQGLYRSLGSDRSWTHDPEGSRSSQSYSSALSFASNASHKFRRKNKLAKRRSGKQLPPPSMTKSASFLNKTNRQTDSIKHRHSSSKPSFSIAVELDCIRCNTAWEHKITLGEHELPEYLRCPQCNFHMGLYVGKTQWDAESFERRVQAMCGYCLKKPTAKIGSESELETMIERAPLGRSAICYVCKYCRVKPFSIGVQKREVFECTFCPRKFRTKFTWERHESTAHEPRVAWICCRTMEYKEIETPSFFLRRCIFCEDEWPTAQHQATAHGVQKCVEQPLCRRIFFRKDQLSQHVRHFHHKSMSQQMADCWKFEIKQCQKTWCCGICGATLDNWDSRMNHIGKHWKSGLTMKSWKINGPGVRVTAGLQREHGHKTTITEASDNSQEDLDRMTDRIFEKSQSSEILKEEVPLHSTRGTVSKWWSKVKRMTRQKR